MRRPDPRRSWARSARRVGGERLDHLRDSTARPITRTASPISLTADTHVYAASAVGDAHDESEAAAEAGR